MRRRLRDVKPLELRRGLFEVALSAALLGVLALVSSAGAHRSGCHRWHSCPSDTGSYTCGDLGDASGCPAKPVAPLAQTRVVPPTPKPATGNPAPVRPNLKLSPGDVLTSDPKVICVPGYTKTVRNVPQSLKNVVYAAYGITSREPGEYEVDHLISLELGGSNSQRNLWPESYKTQPLNAHVKDTLENKLHALTCSGKISMIEAQQAIAKDWPAAYVKYVGPLPGAGTLSGRSSPTAVPNTATSPGAVPPNPDGSCPAGAPIKVSKSGIYHVPGDRDYDRTRAKTCYDTAGDAGASGYRAPKR